MSSPSFFGVAGPKNRACQRVWFYIGWTRAGCSARPFGTDSFQQHYRKRACLVKGLENLESACVCGRNYSWRRILKPDLAKGDSSNWIVAFGEGVSDPRWKQWCGFLSCDPPPIDFQKWGVLLVTNETAEEQLILPYYVGRFNCATVRMLSDAESRVGPCFGVNPRDGKYPFTVIQIQEGKVMNQLF